METALVGGIKAFIVAARNFDLIVYDIDKEVEMFKLPSDIKDN